MPESAHSQSRIPIPATLWGVWCLGVALRAMLAFVRPVPFVDDAYIFMRYAANAGDGHGLVYNVGERVIAFTSPLFAALTTSLHILLPFVDLETLFRVLNLGLFGWVLYLVIRLLSGLGQVLAVGAGSLFATYYAFVYASLNGMETTLYIGCILACILAAKEERSGAAVFWAALGVVSRPEGLFLLLATFLWIALGRRKILTPGAWTGLAVIVIWLGLTTWYYGSPLPQSMLAKSNYVVGGAGNPLASALKTYATLSTGLSSFQLESLGTKAAVGAFGLCALLSVPFFASATDAARRRSFLVVPVTAFLLTVAFYVVGKPVRIWSWYSAPTCATFLMAAVYGVGLWAERRPRLVNGLGLGAAVLGVSSLVVGLARPNVATFDDHRKLADYLSKEFPDRTSIMIGDIGNVGYFYRVRIIDVAGLVSPIVTQRKADGSRLSFGDIVESEKPDLITLQSYPDRVESFEQSLVRFQSFTDATQRDRFLHTYEIAATTSYGPIYARRRP